MQVSEDRIVEKKVRRSGITKKRKNHLTFERSEKTEKCLIKAIKKVEPPKPKPQPPRELLDNYRYLETKEIRRSDRRSNSIVKHQRLSKPFGIEVPFVRKPRGQSYSSRTYCQAKRPNISQNIIENIKTTESIQLGESLPCCQTSEEFNYRTQTENSKICRICGKPKKGGRMSASVDRKLKTVTKRKIKEEGSDTEYILKPLTEKKLNQIKGSTDNYQYRESFNFLKPNLRNSYTFHQRRGKSSDAKRGNRFSSGFKEKYSEKKCRYCPVHGCLI